MSNNKQTPFLNFSSEERRIFERFPKMFRQADLSMQETCMCWGLGIPEDWYPVIEKLAEDINNLAPDAVEFTDIKSKWDNLRVYYDFVKEVSEGVEKEIDKLIEEARVECHNIDGEKSELRD